MQLKEGNLLMEKWKDIPVPLYASYYLFEIKNGREFVKGAKPIMQEHGPYVYK